MKLKYLLLISLGIMIVLSYFASAFFETPSNNIILSSAYTNETNYYVEGYYYNSTGGGTPYTVTITTAGTLYNLTNWTAGETNGFIFSGNGVNVTKAGIYHFDGSMTITGGNGHEYSFVLVKDGTPIQKCGMGRTTSLNTRENLAFTCLVSLNGTEHLTIQVQDKSNPPIDLDVYKVNMNLIKVSG